MILSTEAQVTGKLVSAYETKQGLLDIHDHLDHPLRGHECFHRHPVLS